MQRPLAVPLQSSCLLDELIPFLEALGAIG
jgi:hypothetical protein